MCIGLVECLFRLQIAEVDHDVKLLRFHECSGVGFVREPRDDQRSTKTTLWKKGV